MRKLKEIADSGDLGDIHYIYGNRLNLGQLRADENALWSLGAHDVSVVLYLAGDAEPSELSARGESYMRAGIEDVVFGFLRFDSGLAAHLHLSWLDPHKERRFTVVGSKKMATFDDMDTERKITVYDKGFDQPAGLRRVHHQLGRTLQPAEPNAEPLRIECKHFVDCEERHAATLDGHSSIRRTKCRPWQGQRHRRIRLTRDRGTIRVNSGRVLVGGPGLLPFADPKRATRRRGRLRFRPDTGRLRAEGDRARRRRARLAAERLRQAVAEVEGLRPARRGGARPGTPRLPRRRRPARAAPATLPTDYPETVRAACCSQRTPSSRSATGTRSSAEWMKARSDLRAHRARREEPVGDGAERLPQPVRVGEPRNAHLGDQRPRLLGCDEGELGGSPQRAVAARPCAASRLFAADELVVARPEQLADRALGLGRRLAGKQPAVDLHRAERGNDIPLVRGVHHRRRDGRGKQRLQELGCQWVDGACGLEGFARTGNGVQRSSVEDRGEKAL